MEILALFLALCLVYAFFKISDMNKEKQIYERVKQQLDQAQQDQLALEVSLAESNKDLRAAEADLADLTKQYSSTLPPIFARLFLMEVSAYIHQHGILRQAITFNDDMVREFLTMMFYSLLTAQGSEDAELKALEYASKEHFRNYFMDYVKFSRSGEFLKITGVEGYDLINEIIIKICSNSTDSTLGQPLYKIVKLPELV